MASAMGGVPASNFQGSRSTSDVGADALDHVAAADERPHLLEQLAAAVEHADPGRAVAFVAGPGEEVGVESRKSTGMCGTPAIRR